MNGYSLEYYFVPLRDIYLDIMKGKGANNMAQHDMNELNKVEYLGDGVYVSVSEYGFMKLMTGDYLHPSNTIYLDQPALLTLIEFVKVHAEAWLREE
jgi:hypothetical protein